MLTSGDGGYLKGLVFWVVVLAVLMTILAVESVILLIRGSRVAAHEPLNSDAADGEQSFIDEARVERRRRLETLRRVNLERHGNDRPRERW